MNYLFFYFVEIFVPIATYQRVQIEPKNIGPRKFKCQHCDYTAHTSSNLRNHVRVHTGERPFVCTICNKNFTQKGNMQRHFTKHFAENRKHCPVCKFQYTSNPQLLDHINMHMPNQNL